MMAHPVDKQAAALALLAAIESCKAAGYRRDDVVRVLVANWDSPNATTWESKRREGER